MLASDAGVALLGRRAECDTLARLLAHVRTGESQALVLRGEAGVGKSALLDYLVDHASGFTIARAAGQEYEMELPYAGLHQLCAPLLDLSEGLPEPQRDALKTAFGLSKGPPPDRFVVGLAVLGLLSAMAKEQPLLWVIDDAQWLDSASALNLAFVARRLLAESVGVVFALREPSDVPGLAGLPELAVRGLGDDDARALLDSAIAGRLDRLVKDRIVAESRGNPLALLELPRGLSPAELAGGFGLLDVTPLTSRIEQGFQRRLDSLPVETRQLLLTAAADPVGDAALLWRAADRLGLGAEAAAPAQSAGLIDLAGRVRFRHPLVRSAVYRAATLPERERVHRALADATDPDVDPDRRAWHRAHATTTPDEEIAADLEHSAGRAADRGGVAATAAFLERAAELTPAPERRGERALAAAQAKFDSGASDAADRLLAVAETCPLDGLQRVRVGRLRAELAFALRRGSDASPLLLHAARRLEPLDVAAAREVYAEALAAAIFAGRLSHRAGPREVAAAAAAAHPGPQPPRPIDLLLDGLVAQYTDGYDAGVELLRKALHAFEHDADRDEFMRWFWLAWIVAGELWDDEHWHSLSARAVQLGRESGMLTSMPLALGYRALVQLHAADFTVATGLANEADATAEAIGHAPVRYPRLLLAAWHGVEGESIDEMNDALEEAVARGEGRGIGAHGYARAVLYNGLGRYETALESARAACEYDDLGVFGLALIERIEAGSRSGARDDATAALEDLERRTRAAGTDWALGVRAWSMAMMREGPEADSLYREAIDRLARTRIALHTARANLVYGEWLRRNSRRVEARQHLRAAYDVFDRAGAEAFAERARRELLATGETARRRSDDTRGKLTPQEAEIARLARDGLSNPEIGAQLFISPRTVQYHLRKVFAKLEITSRGQLAEIPPGQLPSA